MNRREMSGVVLYAEDDPDDQYLMRRAFDVVTSHVDLQLVDDGQELLDYLRNVDPHSDPSLPVLVLLDLNMPNKDGREALAEIKADKALRPSPVVVFTTSNSVIDINYSYDHGAVSYVCKPQNFDDLVEFVRDLTSYWFRHVSYAIDT